MICQNVPVTTAEDMAQNIHNWLEGKLDTREADFAVFDVETLAHLCYPIGVAPARLVVQAGCLTRPLHQRP